MSAPPHSNCGHSHDSLSLPQHVIHKLSPSSSGALQPALEAMGGGRTRPPADSGYDQLNFTPKGKQIRKIYQDRMRQFTDSGQYYSVGLRSMFTADSESGKDYVKLEVYSVPDVNARPPFSEAVKGPFKPAEIGQSFGPSWSTHWFRVRMRVPERMKDAERVQFRWDSNSEAMVFTDDGEAVQGLTGGGERTEWIFPQQWKTDGEEHLFYVEMACNGMFGNANGDSIQPPDPNRTFKLQTAEVHVPNLEALALYYDYWIVGDSAREFPANSWQAHEATQVANEIMNQFEVGNQQTVINGRKIAAKYLGERVSSPEVYQSGQTPLVYATGHCHIDSCWLWPFDETKRKVARSWASQCNLMDMYPEHRFTCSSAQQYKWLEDLYPKTFERVKQKVSEGKFQYIGGSWVEHDTNMPNGESLVRQFLLGQRYFESRFGARCQTFWLPDTFGYSAQLPQLCRLAGLTRFFTQKLSWNNINKFEHTTFNWVALDGSQVLTHMPPSETYTSEANWGDCMRSITQHQSLDQDKTSLLVFGKGDGGGGPTMEHIEKLRRCRGVSDTIGFLPQVHQGNSVDDFFDQLEKKEINGQKFVTWYGELYLEFHRGTYTTQARNKKGNRKAEVLMRDLETLATYTSITKDYKYPKKEIDYMWEQICLMQFHDCLPGSSIEMVYRDTDKMYAELFALGDKLLAEVAATLGVSSTSTAGIQPVALALNQHQRTELVKLPAASGIASVQTAEDGSSYAFMSTKGPGIAAPINLAPNHPTVSITSTQNNTVYVMENDKLRVTVANGNITSLVFRETGREVIVPGKKANQLVLYDDKPLYWQAWDVEVYHFETREELNCTNMEVLESGPLRATLLTTTRISEKSWIKTKISLEAAVEGAGQWVNFDCEVEWQEKMKFLKVEFPVDVHNTDANYETQYGILKRPTHYNTSWDMAKFEVCHQRFADLSEFNFGVSILNDCKYGFATSGDTMRLSLLRAPKAPDAHADMGRHTFRYAMFPHSGPLGPATVYAAYDFNNPLTVGHAVEASIQQTGSLLQTVTLSDATSSSIILDAVKRGEDDEDVSTGGLPVRSGRSVVLRFYESMGGKSTTTVNVQLPVKKVFKTNLLEDDLEEVPFEAVEVNGQEIVAVRITLRPFEVATYRLQL